MVVGSILAVLVLAGAGIFALKILDKFQSKLEDVSIVEKPAKKEGRSMTMVLGPKKA